MSDLFSYLDTSGPEYAYLGHFRHRGCIEAGHNTGASGDNDAADTNQLLTSIKEAELPQSKAPPPPKDEDTSA
jgi:hypothetical protein